MLNALRDEMGFGSSLKGEALMSRHIPYTRHVADSVVRLKNDALMSVIKLNGLFFQTEDQAEINLRSAVQNTLIRAGRSSHRSRAILTTRSAGNWTSAIRPAWRKSACSQTIFFSPSYARI